MKAFILIGGLGLVAGCVSDEYDALPNDPMRVLKTEFVAPAPSEAMAQQSGKSLKELERGHAVFGSRCLECHEPRIPVDPTDPSWHMTMRGMSWNAGLDSADEAALIDYMRAAAKE
jgi:cytochrome c2